MKTLKYISKAIQVLTSWNGKTKANAADQPDFEITRTRFGINLKQGSAPDKVSNSLFFHMYSEENEALFI